MAVVVIAIAASTSACADPDANDEGDAGETGEDPTCEVADPPAVTLDPGRRELSLVARVEDIPGVADQATDRGRTIGTLWPHLGRVHLGYGDYDQNTGPISMVSYVPADARFETHGVASAEEIQRFLSHDGDLFTSNVDPVGHEYFGSVFRLESACGEWAEALPIDGAVHTYALLEHADRIWVGTGSVVGAPALVMSSGDGGESWREELAIESAADSFTRVLDGAALGDRLLFTGRSFPTDGGTNFAWQRQGGQWTEVAGVPNVARVVPIAFADRLVVLAFSGEVGKGASFVGGYALDADALVPHGWFPDGFVPTNWHVAAPTPDSEPWFWALGELDSQPTVIVSADLDDWETLATLPVLDEGEPRSLAYEANDLFMGSSTGDLHVLAEVFTPD